VYDKVLPAFATRKASVKSHLDEALNADTPSGITADVVSAEVVSKYAPETARLEALTYGVSAEAWLTETPVRSNPARARELRDFLNMVIPLRIVFRVVDPGRCPVNSATK
jgi:hypothetical protein